VPETCHCRNTIHRSWVFQVNSICRGHLSNVAGVAQGLTNIHVATVSVAVVHIAMIHVGVIHCCCRVLW
jgi:hypothetical protein